MTVSLHYVTDKYIHSLYQFLENKDDICLDRAEQQGKSLY